jgi:phage N-6-adenine-methyltransferase
MSENDSSTKQKYIHFSSETCEWSTPDRFFEIFNQEFAFGTDVCATEENAKCRHFFTKEDDGLSKDWIGTCWMNPPYGREIQQWVRKARESSQRGATVVCLLPARTDTRWFHDECMAYASDIRFIRGRLKFGGAKYNAPFPSCVVVFSPTKDSE